MSADHTYNGWTNWETWNTALWMGNDEYLDSESRSLVAPDDYEDDDTTDRADIISAGADALREWWEATFDPTEQGNPAYPGPVQDAWNATLSETDWRSIAEHIADDLAADRPDLAAVLAR